MKLKAEMMRVVLRTGRVKPCASDPRTADEHAEDLVEQIKATEVYFHQPVGPKVLHSVCVDTKDRVVLADIGTGPRSDIMARIVADAWNLIYEHYKKEYDKELEEREERAQDLGLEPPSTTTPEEKPRPPMRLRTVKRG